MVKKYWVTVLKQDHTRISGALYAEREDNIAQSFMLPGGYMLESIDEMEPGEDCLDSAFEFDTLLRFPAEQRRLCALWAVPVHDEEAIQTAINSIAESAGVELRERMTKFRNALLDDEVTKIITDDKGEVKPYRLARTLLLAVIAEGWLDRQFGAECLNRHVRGARRIYRQRL